MNLAKVDRALGCHGESWFNPLLRHAHLPTEPSALVVNTYLFVFSTLKNDQIFASFGQYISQ